MKLTGCKETKYFFNLQMILNEQENKWQDDNR